MFLPLFSLSHLVWHFTIHSKNQEGVSNHNSSRSNSLGGNALFQGGEEKDRKGGEGQREWESELTGVKTRRNIHFFVGLF